ncbi:MAG: hypothetical protein ACJ752_04470 [Gaiellaceae bacterium]
MIDVEPLIISELERMLPLPNGGRADWSDALRRAGLMSARRRWRPVLIAAVGAAALVGVGVAIAASFGVFHGISAAQHPRTAADQLDPSVVVSIIANNKRERRFFHGRGLLQPETSRLVRKFPNGMRAFAVAATGGELCVVIERLPRLASNMKRGGWTDGCGSPLTQKLTTTLESFRAFKGPHGESPALSWGITFDDVAAISFPANHHQTVTVPVKHNVWVYLGKASATVRGFTVHFKDGHTQTIP